MVHDITWFGNVESTVSHLEPVRKAVIGKAIGMGREAAGALARHRKTGAAHINVTLPPTYKLDATVEMHDADPGGANPSKDRSALSIEFGHTAKDGTEVPGLHILGGVMNRAIGRAKGGRP